MNNRANLSVENYCVVCEKTKLEGIHLYTSFVCNDCERKIIQTETSDPAYRFYLNQLKKIRTEYL